MSFLQKEKNKVKGWPLIASIFLFTTVDEENGGKGFRKVSIRDLGTVCSEVDSKLECAFYKTNAHTIGINKFKGFNECVYYQ